MKISRQHLKKIVLQETKKILYETKRHFQVQIMLKFATDMALYGDVFNKLRAIPGVTIVKVKEDEHVTQIGQGQKAVVLDVKFIPPLGALARYQTFLKNQMMRIKDEQGDKVLGVRFLNIPTSTIKKSIY